jgi:hypothetical protein
MTECIGCGQQIWTPLNENESGEWCHSGGDCEIRSFEGAERLNVVVMALLRDSCQHDFRSTQDGTVTSCLKCHKSK